MNELLESLRQHPVFSALDATALQKITRSAEEIHLAPGEALYTSGALAESVFVVSRGVLQIEFPESGESRGRVVTLMVAPAFLGECQVVNAQPWSGTGIAVTDLTALGIARAEFLRLLETHPELTHRLYLELTRRYLNTLETMRHQPSFEPAEAVARYLVALRAALRITSPENPATRLAIRQADIGIATGLRRETVSRVMSTWVKDGMVKTDRDGVELLAPEAIEALANAVSATPLMQQGVVPLVEPKTLTLTRGD